MILEQSKINITLLLCCDSINGSQNGLLVPGIQSSMPLSLHSSRFSSKLCSLDNGLKQLSSNLAKFFPPGQAETMEFLFIAIYGAADCRVNLVLQLLELKHPTNGQPTHLLRRHP